MNTITTIFTCAAIGNTAPGTSPDIFWLLLIILMLDDEARREREKRRKHEQAQAHRPKPLAGPR